MTTCNINSNNKNIILAAIIVIGIIVRIIGLSHHLPNDLIMGGSERLVINTAVGFGTLDFNPHFHAYGSFYQYLLFVVFGLYYIVGLILGLFTSVNDFAREFFINPSSFYLIARSLVVTFDVLTIWVTYKLAERLQPDLSWLVAALYALLPIAVENAHFIKVDVVSCFFFTISLYFSLIYFSEGNRKNLIWAGIMAGIASATKISGVFAIGTLVAAITLRDWQFKRFLAINYLLGGLTFLGAFFVFNPYFFLDIKAVIEQFNALAQWNMKKLSAEYSTGLSKPIWSAILSFELGYFLTCVSLVEVVAVLNVFRKRRIDLSLTLISPLLLCLFFLNGQRYWSYYFLPAMPVLLICTAFLIKDIYCRFSGFSFQRWLGGIILLLIFGPMMLQIARMDIDFLKKTPGQLVKEWVENNIHADSTLLIYGGLPLSHSLSDLEAKIAIAKKGDHRRLKKYQYMLMALPEITYNLYFIGKETKSYLNGLASRYEEFDKEQRHLPLGAPMILYKEYDINYIITHEDYYEVNSAPYIKKIKEFPEGNYRVYQIVY